MFSWSDFSPFISECVWLMGNSCNLGQSYFGPTVGQGPAAWTFSAWDWDHNPGQMHWRLRRWGCMWFCIEGQLRRNCPGNTVGNLETVLRPRANIGWTCLFTRSLSNLCQVPLPLLLHGVAQCLHTQTGRGPWAPHLLTPPLPTPESGRAAVSLAGVHHRFILWPTGYQAPHTFSALPSYTDLSKLCSQ